MWVKFTTVLFVLLVLFSTWTAAQVTEVAANTTSLPLSRRGMVRNFMSQVQALIANLMKDIEQLTANDGNTINIRI